MCPLLRKELAGTRLLPEAVSCGHSSCLQAGGAALFWEEPRNYVSCFRKLLVSNEEKRGWGVCESFVVWRAEENGTCNAVTLQMHELRLGTVKLIPKTGSVSAQERGLWVWSHSAGTGGQAGQTHLCPPRSFPERILAERRIPGTPQGQEHGSDSGALSSPNSALLEETKHT